MENLSRSHSFSKRSYGGHGFGTATHHKSVYDDVFGGPPKFGMPTLAPSLEDYSEIFGGFHSARGSSVPILDLPVVDEAELSFDVRSSRLVYCEVFGGFNGLDFAVSFEDLLSKSNGGDDPYGGDDDDDDGAWYAFCCSLLFLSFLNILNVFILSCLFTLCNYFAYLNNC